MISKTFLKKGRLFLATIIFDLFLILCVMLLMRHTQDLLASDARLNLAEITKQNREGIANNIDLELKNQQLAARNLATKLEGDQIDAYEMNIALMALHGMSGQNLFVASRDGTVFIGLDEKAYDISDRQYFRRARSGKPNISNMLEDKTNGEKIFISSVPIYVQNKVIGTLQKRYLPQQLYSIIVPPLFSSKGRAYIISPNGTIIISSEEEDNDASRNLFLELNIYDDSDTNIQLRKDISQGKSGVFISETEDGHKIFSAYQKIKNAHDWILVTSINIEAISPHARQIIHQFYIILLVLCLVFGVTLIYIINLKQKERQELERLAFDDPITGGYTFNKLVASLPGIIANAPEAKSWHLLAFDIDKFRYINSFYGFDHGNFILREVCRKISSRLGPNEMLTHLWGDYFAALLCRDNPLQDDTLLAPLKTSWDMSISFSGGLYLITDPHENVRDMYDKASLATSMIKKDIHTSLNLYDDSLNQNLIKNEAMKHRILKAINEEEILPFFQPKVDIITGMIVGAEALARWRKPNGEMISPAEFIPICESSGLVVEVDLLIYRKVLEFIRRHLDLKHNCTPISVNFSRKHLEDGGFVEKLTHLLNKYKVPANLIELELTESLFYDNQKAIIDLVNELSKLDIKVSMDDFGTGYSSLSMLKDVHIDVLKIDQSFLRQSDQKEKRDIIFASIVSMATQLGINVVVEGVETEENVNLMLRCSCRVAQGYYYSKPLPPERFEDIYAQGSL
ncbi:MAG: EAL domain-containing protein [Desulfovibrio sp.]|nr:EAL domain-containing protein [Desulfovibrio sp.]